MWWSPAVRTSASWREQWRDQLDKSLAASAPALIAWLALLSLVIIMRPASVDGRAHHSMRSNWQAHAGGTIVTNPSAPKLQQRISGRRARKRG